MALFQLLDEDLKGLQISAGGSYSSAMLKIAQELLAKLLVRVVGKNKLTRTQYFALTLKALANSSPGFALKPWVKEVGRDIVAHSTGVTAYAQ
jgi:hypothetical protein